MQWGVCLSALLLSVLPLWLCPASHTPLRLSASCGQGPELDWEEVQGTEPHQHLRSPTAFAGPAFSPDDFLGEHASGGRGCLCPFPPASPEQETPKSVGQEGREHTDARALSPLPSTGQFCF